MVCVCVLSVHVLTHTESVTKEFILGSKNDVVKCSAAQLKYFSRPFSEPRKHLFKDSVDTLTLQGDELLNRTSHQ